jgi:hypothetical protein
VLAHIIILFLLYLFSSVSGRTKNWSFMKGMLWWYLPYKEVVTKQAEWENNKKKIIKVVKGMSIIRFLYQIRQKKGLKPKKKDKEETKLWCVQALSIVINNHNFTAYISLICYDWHSFYNFNYFFLWFSHSACLVTTSLYGKYHHNIPFMKDQFFVLSVVWKLLNKTSELACHLWYFFSTPNLYLWKLKFAMWNNG